jgi:hypothetical protein
MAEPDRAYDSGASSSTSAPKTKSDPDMGGDYKMPESLSSSYGGQMSDIAKRIAGVDERAAQQIEATNKARTSILDRIVANESNRPKAPELMKPEAPPQGHTPPNPIQSWGSIASVIAIFGSLATRQPLQNALNASASAMNAIRANDAEAYQRSVEEWKRNAEHAEKVNAWELKRYDILYDQYKNDQDLLLTKFNALAALDQNASLQAALRSKGLSAAYDVLRDQQAGNERLKEYNLRVREFEAQQMTPERLATMQFAKENPHATAAQWTEFNRQIKSPSFGEYANPVEVEITGPDGKKQTVLAQQAKWNGQWVTADEKRTPLQADGIRVLKGSEAGMSGREAVFTQRVLTSAKEAAKDLENVVELPSASSTGWFAGTPSPTSAYDATKQVLRNEMTSQDVQSYNVLATGFQRSLATIEASGLAPAGSLSHQMDALLLKEGDTNLTKLLKLAQIRQIVEQGMEVVEANPRLGDEQRKQVEDVVGRLAKAVPFTPVDLIRLQAAQNKNPNVTLKDVMNERGLSTTEEGAGSSAPGGGGGDLKQRATQAWGSYDPDKYEYRINPQDGSLERRAK